MGAVLAGTGVAATAGLGGELRHAAASPAIETSMVRAAAPASNEPSINQGYWLEARDGGIFPFGAAGGFGSLGGAPLNQPVVGMTATPDGGGYWMVAADGGVFPFGNGGGFGSTGNIALNQPMVAMASTADGKGYWLVARDGGVFPFGNAVGYGSTGNIHLNQPIVGMAATPDGRGYWLVASDGGIFPFGDAGGYGSTGGIHLNQSITNMTSTKDGKGYWLCARDGGIFPFGDAAGYGSTGGVHLNRPIVAMAGTPSGQGYWLGATDGGIFPFGDAQGLGSWANHRLNAPIIATVAAPPIGLISLGGGGPITADQGAAGVPIIFELTRAGGSVVANATIVFSMSGLSHGTLSVPSAVTGSDGKVTVIFKDTFPGDTGTVFASVKNTGSKTAAPLITVSQGAPSVLNIAPNQPAQVSADGSPIIATVTDSVGNPFVGATINFAPAGFAHLEAVTPTSAVTNSAGQATTTLVHGTAGDTGTVTVGVVGGPSGATGPLTVINGAPTGIVVVGAQPAVSYTADQGANPGIVVTFQLNDANLNPVPGVQVTASGPSHGTFPAGTNPQTTAANGQVTFTFHDTYSGGGQFAPPTATDSGPISAVAATGQSGATTSFSMTPGMYNHFVQPNPLFSTATTAGVADGPIVVPTYDTYGNSVAATGAAFSPTGTLMNLSPVPSSTASVFAANVGPTSTSFSITPHAAQTGGTLFVNGLQVAGGVNVAAAAYSFGHLSGVFAGPNPITAGAPSTGVQINTMDAFSNPTVPPASFTFGGTVMTTSPGSNAATPNQGTGGATFRTGVAFTAFASTAGATGTWTLDGVTIGSGITVNPTSTLTTTPSPTTINATTPNTAFPITVTVRDQYGNINGVTASITANDTPGATADGGVLSNNPCTTTNGTCPTTITWTSPASLPTGGSGTLGFTFATQTVAITD